MSTSDPAPAGVPTRSEVAEADTWDLSPLYATDAAWEADFSDLQSRFAKIEAFRGTIGTSAAALAEVLEFQKSISLQIDQLNQYAALRVTEDSSNGASLAREAKLDSLRVRVGSAFAFLDPEIQAIPDEVFESFLGEAILNEWQIPLRKLRRMRAHTLTAGEERLLALGAGAIAGHHETFSQLTNVDMTFGLVRDGSGRERPLTQSSFSSFLQQRDPEVRRTAFHQFYREFEAHRFTLASSLASSVRADVFYARARNFPSAREAALFPDNVPLGVYDNLIATVRGRLDVLFRYFDLRKRTLGLPEIHHYDTYVPLVADASREIPWNDAVDEIALALQPLGTGYVETLRAGLTHGRWCDRYENKGKRSGAFSYGTYQSPPYIMMNYKSDVFSDVYTLAHEGGHSMHTWYAQRSQSYQNYHYPIFLAEVASTFNEILLTEHLLSRCTDRALRAFILNRQIDDLRGTLYRQTMFAEFERDIHAAEEAGEPLTLDAFRGIYRALLDAYFGPDFSIDDVLELECLRIPHFYSAFYVYKYATGISAAVALASQVIESGDASRYIGFLESGGSRYPIETLALAGVNMLEPQPVQAALDLFERRVAELEDLLGV